MNSVEVVIVSLAYVLQAANQGAKFKGRVLQISWYKPKTPSVTTEPEEEEAKDDDNTVRYAVYLTFHGCVFFIIIIIWFGEVLSLKL